MPTKRTKSPNEREPSEASIQTSTSGTTLPHSAVLLAVDNEEDDKTEIEKQRVPAQQQFALVAAHESPTAGASAFACQRGGISSGLPHPCAETDVQQCRSKNPGLDSTRTASSVARATSRSRDASRPKNKAAKGPATNFTSQIPVETTTTTINRTAKKSKPLNTSVLPSASTATFQVGSLKAQQQREVTTTTGKVGSDERKKKRIPQRVGGAATPRSRATAQQMTDEGGIQRTHQTRKAGGTETETFPKIDVGMPHRDENASVAGVGGNTPSGGVPISTSRHRNQQIGAQGFAGFAAGKDLAVASGTPISSQTAALNDTPSQTQPSCSSGPITRASYSGRVGGAGPRAVGATPGMSHRRGCVDSSTPVEDEGGEVTTLDDDEAKPTELHAAHDCPAISGRRMTAAESEQVPIGSRVPRAAVQKASVIAATDNVVQVIGTSESRTPTPKDILPSRRKSNASASPSRVRPEHITVGSDRSDSTSSSLSGTSTAHAKSASGTTGDPDSHHAVIQVLAGHSANVAQPATSVLNRRDSNGSAPEDTRAAASEASSPLQRSHLDAAAAAAANAVVANAAALDEERGRTTICFGELAAAAAAAAAAADSHTVARVVEQLRQQHQQQQEAAAISAIARRQFLHQHNHHPPSQQPRTTMDEAAAAAAAIRAAGLEPILFHSSVNGGSGGTGGGASTGSSTTASATVLDQLSAHMISALSSAAAGSTPTAAPIVPPGGGGNHYGLLGLSTSRSAPPPPPAPAAASASTGSAAATFPFSNRALFDGTLAFMTPPANGLLVNGRSASTGEGGDTGSHSSTTERSRRISASKTQGQRRNARSQGGGSDKEVITIESSDDDEEGDEDMQDTDDHCDNSVQLKRNKMDGHDTPNDLVRGDYSNNVAAFVARDGEQRVLQQQRNAEGAQNALVPEQPLKTTTGESGAMLDVSESTGVEAHKRSTSEQHHSQRKKMKRNAAGEAEGGPQSMIRSVLKSFNSTSSKDGKEDETVAAAAAAAAAVAAAAAAAGETGIVTDKADGAGTMDSVAKDSRWTKVGDPVGRGRKRAIQAVADGRVGDVDMRAQHRKVEMVSKLQRQLESGGSLKTSLESQGGQPGSPNSIHAERGLPRGHINTETLPLKDAETSGQFDDDEDCANTAEKGEVPAEGAVANCVEDSPIEIIRVQQPPQSKNNGRTPGSSKDSATADEGVVGGSGTKVTVVKRLPVSFQLETSFVNGMLTEKDEVFAGVEGVPDGDLGLAIGAAAKNLIRVLPASAKPNAAGMMYSRDSASASKTHQRKSLALASSSATSIHVEGSTVTEDGATRHQHAAGAAGDQQQFVLTRSDFEVLATEVVADRRRVARTAVQKAFIEMSRRHEQLVAKLTAQLSSKHSRTKQPHPVAKLQQPLPSSLSSPSLYSPSVGGSIEERDVKPPPAARIIAEEEVKPEIDTRASGEQGAKYGSGTVKTTTASRENVNTETASTQSSVTTVASVNHLGLMSEGNKGAADVKDSAVARSGSLNNSKNEMTAQDRLASQERKHEEELQKKDKEISELQNRLKSLQQQQLTDQVRHSHEMDAMETENKEFVAKLVKHHHDIVGRTKSELKEERARHERELRSYMAASAHALRRFREGRKDKDGNSIDFPAVVI